MRPPERYAVGLVACGLVLAVADLAGLRIPLVYAASVPQAALHAALAGAGALLLLLDEPEQRAAVRGVAILLLALSALGTLTPGLLGLAPRLGLGFELGENAAHALLGAWGVYAART